MVEYADMQEMLAVMEGAAALVQVGVLTEEEGHAKVQDALDRLFARWDSERANGDAVAPNGNGSR